MHLKEEMNAAPELRFPLNRRLRFRQKRVRGVSKRKQRKRASESAGSIKMLPRPVGTKAADVRAALEASRYPSSYAISAKSAGNLTHGRRSHVKEGEKV